MAHYERLTASRLEDALSMDLKQSDKDELRASTGHEDFVSTLQASIDASGEVYLIVDDDGSAIGVFGLSPDMIMEGRAFPWLLGTERLTAHSLPFLRQSKEMVKGWAEEYPILCNFVSSKNLVSQYWLQWLGFELDKAHPVFLEDPDVPFYPFWMVQYV